VTKRGTTDKEARGSVRDARALGREVVETVSLVHVLGKLALDVARRRVLADVEVCSGTAENGCALRHCASDLFAVLPDHLRPVRKHRTGRVVAGLLVVPRLDACGDAEPAGASGEVFAERSQRAARVLEHAVVCPLLCLLGQSIAPGERRCVVIDTLVVVPLEICGLVRSADGAAAVASRYWR